MAGEKILIVDDQNDFVTLTKYFFEKNGYKVSTARNGAEALEKAKEIPAIILLDISLPGLSGFDILHRLRLDETTSQIPVIMLTASANLDCIFESQHLRADDYIIKTESFEKILAIVKKYIFVFSKKQDYHERVRKLRRSGIDALGDLSWGKHVCAFYGIREDLLKMLVPYFKAGLSDNELCVWVLSDGLKAEEAIKALGREIKDLDLTIERGQMKIFNSEDLYMGPAGFDPEKALNFWDKEEKNALARGFDGIRVSGSGNWAGASQWQNLCDYEKRVNAAIPSRKIIALCTYSFYKFSMPEIIAVGMHHVIIVARQNNRKINFIPRAAADFLEHLDSNGGIKI